jgi:SAM-dependent methyltransferase
MDYKKFQEYEQRAMDTVYSEIPGGFHDTIIKELASKFLPDYKLNPDACIVDSGCGQGLFAKEVMSLGYTNVTGVTLSPEDVAACEQKGYKVKNANMSDLPWQDSTVDFIWCRHALEHSPYPLFTLYEFHRVLKPGGHVFIEVPAPDNERTYMHEYNPNHYSILGVRMWLAMFIKVGFETKGQWVYTTEQQFNEGIFKENSLIFSIQRR